MLWASLVRVQGSAISVIAQETVLEPLAAGRWDGDGGAANDQLLELDTWQVLQLLQLADKGLQDLLGCVVAELEENWLWLVAGDTYTCQHANNSPMWTTTMIAEVSRE